MGTKFQVGDRVRIHQDLFPSYDEGLFNSLPKTGKVLRVDPASILAYRVAADTFEHHPFWFYENQLVFEDDAREKAWQDANRPKPRVPGAAAAKTAPSPATPTTRGPGP